MKPLTNDQPRLTLPQAQAGAFEWGFDQRQQPPVLDMSKNDVPGLTTSVSTGSGSPPFSLASAVS